MKRVLVIASLCTACGVADPVPSKEVPPAFSTYDVGVVSPVVPTTRTASPPAAPPARSGSPVSYGSPEEVTAAWLAEWCARDWMEPMNAYLTRAARFQTEAAAVKDREHGDTGTTYAVARQQELSTRCDRISAVRSPEAPSGNTTAYLIATARQVNLAAGVPFGEETVSSTRRVVKQADGRWLVDMALEAG